MYGADTCRFRYKNSISKVTSDQYGTIFAYDIAGEFSEASDKDSFYDEYKENKNIKDIYIMTSHMETAKKSESEDTTKNVTIVSVDDGKGIPVLQVLHITQAKKLRLFLKTVPW